MKRRLFFHLLPILAWAFSGTLAQAQCTLNITASDADLCLGDSTVLTANGPITSGALTTTLVAGNNHRGNMFNIVALNTITITSFDAHPMGNTDYAIYYKVGTHVGFETNSAAWALVGTAPGVVAQPFGTPTPLPIPVNITIPAGQTYAFYVTSTNTAVSQNYSNGTAVGNVYASDANLQFIEGTGQEYPFGSTFSPRIFNGVIHYSRPGTYAWSTGATSQSITVAPNTAASYSCTVNVPSISCTVSDTIDITVSALPTVNLGNDSAICAPASMTLDAGNAGNTFSWSTGDTTQTILASTSAAYSVMVTDSNGCSGTDTLNLTVNPQPLVTLPNDTLLCPGSSISADAGNPGSSYAWSTGGSGQSEIILGGFSGPVSVAVTNGNGCVGTDTVVISATVGILDLGADSSICAGANALLDAGAANSGWSWSTGDTTQNIVVSSAGTYSATAFAIDGCLLADTVVLTALSAPVASFTATTTSLTLNITNNSTGATTYAWDFGDGNSSTAATPAHTYAADGSYTVTLIATNSCGSDTSTFTLTAVGVMEGSNLGLSVYPNPSNGDFMLRAEGLQAGNLELTIYALDGKVVYRSEMEADGTTFERSVKADLPSGNYLLRLVAGEQQVTRRISVQ